jgi:predicted TIM-barrel fold metal-dependent hydrolase
VIVTDAQVHIFEADRPDRPWAPDGHTFAHTDELRTETLLAEMDAASVDRAVLVPPSFEGDRNDYCLEAAAKHPDRFRVMGRISLADPASRGKLATWLDQPGMLGVRVSFSRGPSARWLHDGTADWFWPEAEAAGLPVMIFAPFQSEQVAGIAERFPGIRLVLDHLGIQTSLRDEQIDPEIDAAIGLARFDNVAAKVSSLPSFVTDPYPYRSLHERIRRVVDAYSPRRAFWGSDLSRLRGTYDEGRRFFVEELDFLSGADLEWVMGRGVSEWLGWRQP